MDRDIPHPRFRSPVVAALEVMAQARLNGGQNGDSSADDLHKIDRTIAIVEAAAAKLKANDFSAVEALFAGQALALDAMFDKHARETAFDDIRLALRSQQQCRATLRALMQMKIVRDEKNSRKRTEEPAKPPA